MLFIRFIRKITHNIKRNKTFRFQRFTFKALLKAFKATFTTFLSDKYN